MWNRACPLCFSRVPLKLVLIQSDDLICPCCERRLQLSGASLITSVICGLTAAALAVAFVNALRFPGQWASQVISTVLSYLVGSSFALYFCSDLSVRAESHMSVFPHSQR